MGAHWAWTKTLGLTLKNSATANSAIKCAEKLGKGPGGLCLSPSASLEKGSEGFSNAFRAHPKYINDGPGMIRTKDRFFFFRGILGFN